MIYLFQSGAPSQFELLDHKPALAKAHGQVLGSEFFGGQRLTGMTSGQKEKKVCKSIYNFSRHGQSGTELSELLPHLGQVADELCVVRSMQTQAINHDPAITFFQTGFQQAGRPSMGAWASYGLGQRERRFAGLRGDDFAGQRQARFAGAVRAALGQRFFAVGTSGGEVSLVGRPGAVPVQPGRHHGQAAAADT